MTNAPAYADYPRLHGRFDIGSRARAWVATLRAAFGAAATVVLLGAGVWSSSTPSAAASDLMCQGLPATVVGSGAEVLRGSPGPDVIVSNGARFVDGMEGDDVVCMTRNTPSADYRDTVDAAVDAGLGDDTVDTAAVKSEWVVEVDLGEGADRLIGGPSSEHVDACVVEVDDETFIPSFERAQFMDDADVVSTSGGNDHVQACAEPVSDTFDLGEGDDVLRLHDAARFDGHVAAGDGADTLVVDDFGLEEPADLMIDMEAGTASAGGMALFSWESFTSLFVPLPGASLVVHGSDRRDRVTVTEGVGPALIEADLHGGDDKLRVEAAALAANSRVNLGDGHDHFELEVPEWTRVVADLHAGSFKGLRAPGARLNGSLTAVEKLDVTARVVRLSGTPGSDRLRAIACDARAVGGRGSDVLALDDLEGRGACDGQWRHHASGGPGNDTLRGGYRRDVLIGGRGRDTANGGNSVDECDAERRVNCERDRRRVAT